MEHEIDWYMGLMDELDEEFDPVVTLFDKIDDMIRPTWSLPTDFTNVIKDVMAVIDTGPSDAINSGAIALSGSTPIFSVAPQSPHMPEYDRVEAIEDNLTAHFKRGNKRGDGTLMYDIAESSLRHNTICVRVDDLAHILPKDSKKWSTLQRMAWAQGRFLYKAYNAKLIRYMHSDLGLTVVGFRKTMRVMDAINHWELYENNSTKEGDMIATALGDLKDALGEEKKKSGFDLKKTYLTQAYMIDHQKLCIWGSLTDVNGEDISRSTGKDFVFSDQENPYGFIPFSVRVAGSRIEDQLEYRVNPLLAPLYWSGSWDKLNLAKSIVFSEPIRRARSPRAASFTTNGDPVKPDYLNGSDIALQRGDEYKPFQPITMDANAIAVINALEAAQNRTTGASMIGDTTKISSNTPFSTFSAMVKVALSRLDKQREIMALATEDIACCMMWWVSKTGTPLTSYAETDKQYKSGKKVTRGMKIETIPPNADLNIGDFSLNYLGISAKVIPMTPTDRMEQLNMAILLSTKMNMPASQLLQEMGYENVGLSYELWVREYLKNAEVQAQAAAMQAEAVGMANIKVAGAQQAMMQQAQAQEQGGGAPAGAPAPDGSVTPNGGAYEGGGQAEAAFASMGGSPGFNPAMGGGSPMQGAPTMTREAVTGKNRMQR